MAEVWAAAVGAGAALYGAYNQAQAAKSAGRRSSNAADAATAEQRREYDQTRQDQMPWLNTGKAALNRLAGLYNLNDNYGANNFSGTVGTPGYETGSLAGPVEGNSSQYNQFYQSPDYQFSLHQGLQGLDRSAAARGGLYSGGHQADVLNYAEGLASQNYNNYANRLAGLAGIGQSTATNLGNMGAQTASRIGNIGLNNAQLQNQSSYDSTNAWTNGLNSLMGLAGQYFGNRAPNTAGTFTTGNALAGGTFTGNAQNPNLVGWPGMNNQWGQL